MITGNYTLAALDAMANTDQHVFYLTGSRFFECEDRHSDWDFFTVDTPQIREWLTSKGFSQFSATEYENPLQEVTAVYRLIKADGTPAIDVQLTLNVGKRSRIQQTLKELQGNRRPTPSEWELGFALAD